MLLIPLPPPVMTTVRPLAEKRSEGLMAFEVSIAATRRKRVGARWYEGVSVEQDLTCKDYSVDFAVKVEEKAWNRKLGSPSRPISRLRTSYPGNDTHIDESSGLYGCQLSFCEPTLVAQGATSMSVVLNVP